MMFINRLQCKYLAQKKSAGIQPLVHTYFLFLASIRWQNLQMKSYVKMVWKSAIFPEDMACKLGSSIRLDPSGK